MVNQRVSNKDLKEALERLEGNFQHMYLDSAGLVTVGIGHKIDSATEAATLEFFVRSGEVERDRFKNLKPENKSPDFRDKTPSDDGDSREVTVQKATTEQIKNEFSL